VSVRFIPSRSAIIPPAWKIDTVSQPNEDHRLWFLLLGAMLSSSKAKGEALAKISLEDVPKPLMGMWKAIRDGKAEEAKIEAGGWQMRPSEGTIIEQVVRTLQERALEDCCRKTLSHVEFAKGLTPAQLLDLLDSLSSKVRAKQASLEKKD
jgi:hypothetical protein